MKEKRKTYLQSTRGIVTLSPPLGGPSSVRSVHGLVRLVEQGVAVTIPCVDCSYVFFPFFMYHPSFPTSPAVPVHDPSGRHVIQHHMTDRLGHLPAARVNACPAIASLLYHHLRLLMDHYG